MATVFGNGPPNLIEKKRNRSQSVHLSLISKRICLLWQVKHVTSYRPGSLQVRGGIVDLAVFQLSLVFNFFNNNRKGAHIRVSNYSKGGIQSAWPGWEWRGDYMIAVGQGCAVGGIQQQPKQQSSSFSSSSNIFSVFKFWKIYRKILSLGFFKKMPVAKNGSQCVIYLAG